MEKKNIRKIVRAKMPETNSSSSHSITISNNIELCENPQLQNLVIESDGWIRFNDQKNFGWEWEKYNDSYTKSLYVLATLGMYHKYNPKEEYLELEKIFKEVICDYTGADGVEIKCYPTIDHQSTDTLDTKLLRDKDYLKEFIFNPGSWLFLGNDNDDHPSQFFIVPTETYPYKVIIHFPGIGDDIYEFRDYPTVQELNSEIWSVVNSLNYDPKSDSMINRRKIDASDTTSKFVYICIFNEKLLYVNEELVAPSSINTPPMKYYQEIIGNNPEQCKFIDYEIKSEFGVF